jgi:large subunit ribosomal protein L25
MISLPVRIRKEFGRKVKKLREKDILPGILYGPGLKEAQPLELDYKTFEKVYREAGESSLISLEIQEKKKKYPVLIHELQRDPLTGKIIHVDFYQVSLEEEIVARIPLVFEGTAPAVKDLGGTLVKNISEVEVKCLPQKLPKEIKVEVSGLRTFEDNIRISDLKLPEGVKILKDFEEIVVTVLPPEKVEEELVKPIEEKVEEVEKVEEKKEEEESGSGF